TIGLTNADGAMGLTAGTGVTVTYSVNGVGTDPADPAMDFSAGTTVVIPSGQTFALITVTVSGDTTPEKNETFEVMLSGTSAFMLEGTTKATGTIINDDAPTIGFLNQTFTANEGNTGTTPFLFTITLSESAPFPVTVSFSTTDGTAMTSDMDYGATNMNVTFPAGQTSVVVTVPVTGDGVLEADETFTVMLTNAMAPGVTPSIVNGTGTATIVNDDSDPAVTLLGPNSFAEMNATNNVIYTLSLSTTSPTATTVTFALADGTANNTDYTPFTQTIAIPANTLTFTVPVTILGDTVPEADETFNVSIMAAQTMGTTSIQATIGNDDALNVSIIGGTSATENAAFTTPFAFTISLDKTANVPVTVSYLTNDGTATAGSDYMDNDGVVTFAPGQSLATVFVTAIDDTSAEPDETFTVALQNITGPGNNQGMLAAPSIATGTIVNDDVSQVSILGLSLAEGTSSNTNFVFTLSLDATNSLPITVTFSTMDVSASAGTDYTAISGQVVTILPTTQVLPVTVTVSGDSIPEANETFLVQIDGTNGMPGTTVATGTIVNDDFVTVSLQGSISQLEGDVSGSPTFTYTISLSQTSSTPITVSYATIDNSATTADNDYNGLTTTIVVPAGSLTVPITVTANGDTMNEPDENFFVGLTGVSSPNMLASLGTTTQATAVLINDDLPGLGILDVMQTEGNSNNNFIFTFTLAQSSTLPTTVTYSTQSGTALDTSDFAPINMATAVIPAGQTSVTVPVTISGDGIPEADETFAVVINASNAPIAKTTAFGTIVNDDFVTVSLQGSLTALEGNVANSPTFVYTISLSSGANNTAAQPITVSYATVDGIAMSALGDYNSLASTVVFTPGTSTALITVTANGDTMNEPDEDFFVQLTMVDSPDMLASISTTSQATAVLINDDTDQITVSLINGFSANEGNSGTTNFLFTISLSETTTQPVTVSFSTMDGTAMDAMDYAQTSGVVTFNPGASLATIIVPVSGDTIPENDETFTVQLLATNVMVGTTQQTGTIVNDDFPGVSILGSISQLENQATPTTYVYTISLSQTAEVDITVSYATNDNTATVANMDYTDNDGLVTIAAGSTTQLVTVTVIPDSMQEPDETFNVTISNAMGAGATIVTAASTATGVIINDDASVGITPGTVSNLEDLGPSMPTDYVFTITLSTTLPVPTIISYNTNDGTANAGMDYVDNDGLVTIPVGQTLAVVTVTSVPDGATESDETFTVTINNNGNNNITVSQPTATGVLVDNDFPGVGLIGPGAMNEGTSANTDYVFTIFLGQTAPFNVTVTYSITDMTTDAMDFAGLPTTTVAIIPAGSASVFVTVTVSGDNTIEPDETFSVQLTGSNATINNALSQAIGTIVNDDFPQVNILPNTVSQLESNTAFVYTISLTGTSPSPTTVTYQTQNGTALAPGDFNNIPLGTATIASGQTTALVTVTVSNDTIPEGNENFTVNLLGSNAPIGQSVATGVIQDDDPVGVGISGSISALEGNSGTNTSSFIYSVTLTQTAAQPVTVSYTVANGTASSGSDFVANSGTVVIPAGNLASNPITVTVSGDTTVEPNENFFVQITGTPVSVAGLSATFTTQTQATGVIINDDLGDVVIVPNTVAQSESMTAFVYTISLTQTNSNPVTVTYQTQNGSAVAPGDFTNIPSAVVTIAPGQTTALVTVTVSNDTIPEGNENFTVNLLGSNAPIGQSVATGVIQ
ncbi:MAG: beta strand repeat-containing protein, partial [Pseudanabaenaceae cyanobacterium]